ncbi:YhcG family protein [Chryseobacterium sp. P1-3]|uniref:PDDEXK nuclease domain-containing protein n=1 Tax=Chryseobacterium sp. (strain P1-3) TaxID=1517683 RepID=UPI001EE64257|nr:PDDEXK nuclease domain-containing protein [Chryseobacterium sp. P1-3]
MAERPQNYNKTLYNSIAQIIIDAKSAVYRNTNSIVLKMYWEIGKLIIEEEQNGQSRAQYGKSILKNLANQLTLEFGKGFNERNLNNMRAFFRSFPIWNAVRTELSWTHYRIISRIENPEHRLQYMIHSIEGNWNTRTLQRNIDSQYLGRLLKFPESDSRETSHFIKDPYIFEFLGLPSDSSQTETQIESALISHLQQFFNGAWKRVCFCSKTAAYCHGYFRLFLSILYFYNYYLKCFILVDLKTHKLTHEAIGQMDMYVRMYNDLKKNADDNPTIGIILCTEKDETVVKYSVLSENKKLFASKYRTYLPDENELKQLIEADRVKLELDNID